MYGAILGDMIGAPYEFDRGNKTKDFEMFNDRVCFTDDSVMTIAVADALMRICWRKMQNHLMRKRKQRLKRR